MGRCFEVIPYKNEKEWLDLRRVGLSATDAATVLGKTKWNSPYRLWLEKLGLIQPRDLSGREDVEWGHRLEEPLRIAYSEKSGRWSERSQQMLRSTKYPWAQCTLDAWTGELNGEEERPRVVWPCELKTCSFLKRNDWAVDVATYYKPQLQLQLLVTGCDRITVPVLIGGQQMKWFDRYRDQAMIDRIIETGEEFMALIRGREPPPVDGSVSTREALKLRWPKENGKTITLGDDFLAVDAAVKDIRAHIASSRKTVKEAEDELRKFENVIVAAIEDNERAVLPNGTVYELSTVYRQGHTVKPSSSRSLKRIDGSKMGRRRRTDEE